jgi:hypothetical protein
MSFLTMIGESGLKQQIQAIPGKDTVYACKTFQWMAPIPIWPSAYMTAGYAALCCMFRFLEDARSWQGYVKTVYGFFALLL